MIVDGHASLVVLSTELTAAEITRALGVEPTTSRERGEPRSRRRPDDRTGEHAYWCVDVPGADGDDPLEPIRALARVFRPRIEALNALRAMCDVRVWWHGSSDSAQGDPQAFPLRTASARMARRTVFQTAHRAIGGDDGNRTRTISLED